MIDFFFETGLAAEIQGESVEVVTNWIMKVIPTVRIKRGELDAEFDWAWVQRVLTPREILEYDLTPLDQLYFRTYGRFNLDQFQRSDLVRFIMDFGSTDILIGNSLNELADYLYNRFVLEHSTEV